MLQSNEKDRNFTITLSKQNVTLKGFPSKNAKWIEHIQNVQVFPYAHSVWLFYQYLCKRSTFFLASNLSSKGHSHVGSLFTNEEQKKAGS